MSANGCEQSHIGFNGFQNQVKADHTQHHTTGKTQKQADGSVGILLQQRTNQTADTGTGNTRQGCGDNQCLNNARK